jgi:hypothetical protein
VRPPILSLLFEFILKMNAIKQENERELFGGLDGFMKRKKEIDDRSKIPDHLIKK